jgi:2-polyprenyl-3-methyl-5-hydroxy-6-metoxy-1,4-benzoquinol methylase
MQISINEGIEVVDKRLCLLCGSEGGFLYKDLRDRLFSAPGIWNLMYCAKCEFAWLNPFPLFHDIPKLYQVYYTHEDNLSAQETFKRPLSKVRMSELLVTLRKLVRDCALFDLKYKNNAPLFLRMAVKISSLFLPLYQEQIFSLMALTKLKNGKLLDIGCGNGGFLSQMAELDWEVYGVELDKEAISMAKKKEELRIFEGTLQDAQFKEETFDVITMNHVIEHLGDPLQTLEECFRILKKGGKLVVITPNLNSFGHLIFKRACRILEPPRHLYLFSAKSLLKSVEKGGFITSRLQTLARTGGSIYHLSWLIKHYGKVPQNLISKNLEEKYRLLLSRAVFGVFEYFLSHFVSIGEEILMIGVK